MNKPRILVETNQSGISKLTLDSAGGGEAGLRLLRNSLPALRLFNSLLPHVYEGGPGEESKGEEQRAT